jgi:GSCFA family protein
MKRSRSPFGQRYPRHVSEFDDLEQMLEEQVFQGYAPPAPFLGPNDEVVTMGSCFAVNIGDSLSSMGMRVAVNRFHEEANSPLANLLLLEYLIKKEQSQARSIFEPFIPLSDGDALLAPLRTARCLILTVGVGITCYHKVTGELVLRPNETGLDQIRWEFTDPNESARHLRIFVQTIQELNPGIQTVLTLSPIPLYRAITTPSPFVEDCISKSHLRVALQRFFEDQQLSNVHYWPSFEAFRWVSGHTGPLYGGHDDLPRHASKDVVAIVAKLFVKYFASGPLPGPLPSAGAYDEKLVL